MDYLDPKKQLQHRIILLSGYVCLAIAIVIAGLILLYQAYGFGLGKNGTVIQSGLMFLSSQPHPASISLNGGPAKTQTNSRLVLPEGIYRAVLSREGYRSWQRSIEIDGGSVVHFDYPFLFPKTLQPKNIHSYDKLPSLMTQSPDRRWLLMQPAGAVTDFELYDLKNPTKPATALALPPSVLSKAVASQSFELSEWADDNRHVVLQHTFDGKVEYILFDRATPDKSVNLNTTLSATPSKLTLNNKKYDQYYLYSAATGELQTASLSNPAPVTVLQHVLGYKSYGNNTILYVTDLSAPAGKVLVKLAVGDRSTTLRSLLAGGNYLLDLTKYSGTLYVVMGASAQNKVYIYKDPIGQLSATPKTALIPAQVFHVVQPNFLSFSTNAQFIVVENGSQFGVYDIENTKGYAYTVKHQIDSPATHATWMDGHRLTYVSQGRLIVFDYDAANLQSLESASSSFLPAFTPDYHAFYSLAANPANAQLDLTRTPLLTPADQ